jgi:signal transduction histidine kinase
MRLGLAGRLILFGALAAAALVLVAWWVLHGALHEAMRSSFEQRLAERAELIAARFTTRQDDAPTYAEPRGGDDFGRIFSGWYWRVRGTPLEVQSRSLWDAELSGVTEVAPSRLDAVGPREEPLFGIVRTLAREGRDDLRLEVFGPAAPVLDELRAFDRHLLLMLAGLLLALGAVSLAQVRFGLRPLARLRAALTAVEDGARERLGGGYGPDLDPFAGELDGLLERNARIVARARGHAADLAHALKKPLALLRGEADAARQVPSDLIRAQVQSVVQLIDRHLARAGSGAGESRRVALRPRLESLTVLMRRLHANRRLQWQLDLPESLHWRGEPTDLEEMLGNLMDNAGKWARTQVRISAIDRQGQLLIRIDDDGPGLGEAQLAQAAQRGTRFDQQVEGTGLGLAICADIAGTYQGTLELTRGPLGGLRAELMLPD